ncbi:MAG TPA: SpoIID/LytB domain-containing protein [Actinomycetota bacterium]|nr:SpoIID/LytB domain-containing protein [Actinomycetota bacterium]
MRFIRLSFIAAAVLIAVFSAGVRPPAEAYPRPNVDFRGHGWGHGRGMGQYGALGYAVDHGAVYTSILDHFYSGTTMHHMHNEVFGVRLTRFDNIDTIVVQEKGHMRTSAIGGTYSALRAVRIGANTYRVDQGPHCAGPWTPIATQTGPVVFSPTQPSDDRTEMLQACEINGTRWYRGEILAVQGTGSPCTACTVNRIDMQQYLRGVLPRESPSSWGNLGSRRGMHALYSQAVAARSYASSENRYASIGAKTCDTTACQVYQGRASQLDGVFRDLEGTPEYANTDAAVADTYGQVRVHSSGAVARTEFSSSTGGYSAGGTFPAVVDHGDDITSNPNHNWTASIPVSQVEGAWPEIGRLVSFDVTSRNGLGDMGGRVLSVRIRGTVATITKTGDQVRLSLGLKSNWFSVVLDGGYWIAADDGGVFSFGSASFFGSMGGRRLDRPVVGIESTVSKQGYWLVASDGGIFAFGDASYRGSTGGMALNRPVVGMARSASGNGYWLVASDGGIFSFGDAPFQGSTGAMRLNWPVVGMARTPSGNGYWLVAQDGGVFAFGDAGFYGSTGAMTLNWPMVGMAPTPSGRGYWLVAQDGGVFAFGDAGFYGSTGNIRLSAEMVGMAATPNGDGYFLVARDGGVFTFGAASFQGSVPQVAPTSRSGKVGITLSYPVP